MKGKNRLTTVSCKNTCYSNYGLFWWADAEYSQKVMNNYKVSEKRETVLLTKNQLAIIIIHSFLHRCKDFMGQVIFYHMYTINQQMLCNKNLVIWIKLLDCNICVTVNIIKIEKWSLYPYLSSKYRSILFVLITLWNCSRNRKVQLFFTACSFWQKLGL